MPKGFEVTNTMRIKTFHTAVNTAPTIHLARLPSHTEYQPIAYIAFAPPPRFQKPQISVATVKHCHSTPLHPV